MKKSFTRLLRNLLMMLFVSMVSIGTYAVDLKPYPVFFPLADYPEFNFGNITNKWVAPGDITSLTWYNTTPGTYSNCPTIGYVTAPSGAVTAIPYGHGLSLATGYNRATNLSFKTPYLNPGVYRVYLGVNYNGSNTRNCNFFNVKLDTSKLVAPADTASRFLFFGSSSGYTPAAPNKRSTKYTGTAIVRNYDIYCGTVTVYDAGRHDFMFTSTSGGESYVYSLLSFMPVTDTNLDSDYAYPMFDMGGNVFFEADSLSEVNNTAVAGYYLPYQAPDPTAYTTYGVVLDAGLYFANKQVVVKRSDDKWTRLYVGTADATGKCTAQLPAGSYFVEVNKAVHTTSIEVTGASTKDIGVSTANINVSYSPEDWYIGKSFKVYDPTGTVLLWDFVIPGTGLVPMFALPVVDDILYKYSVINDDETTFEEGTISVTSTDPINLDLTQVKSAVTVNFGNDTYGQSQPFTIVRSDNSDALYVSNTSSSTGTYDISLPDGTYYITTASKLVYGTFTVSGSGLTVDISARYTANICLGKTVAGANVDVFLSSTGALLYSLVLDADGKVACTGMPNGRYYHALNVGSTEITNKFTFVIEGADFEIGDCGNPEQPYYKPYPVYFNVSNQPEITWMTGKSFQPGDLQYIKFDNVPIDTIYAIIDTTWIYGADTTYVINYDYNTIESITYFDWSCTYGFNGISYDKSDNAYIWGDRFNIRIPANGKVTFVTPNLNPGLYNVYITNRWGNFVNRPTIDTTYMDGRPLATNGAIRSFAGNSDNYNGGMQAAGLLRNMNRASNGAPQAGLYMGEALVTSSGRHDLTLYSILGNRGGSGGTSTIWMNMIYFIPVDQDSVPVSTNGSVTTYNPRVDYAGNLVYSNAANGNTTVTSGLGSDGINRSRYPSQFVDPSVLKSDLVDYAKTLTIDGGIYSAGDKVTTVSPVDNWTIRQATADTITGIATLPLLANADAYDWAMWTEGVEGEVVMNESKTITIPTEITTAVTSTFTVTPYEEDPGLGIYFLNSTVSITDNLGFYYPITGVILYDLNGTYMDVDGDTIYRVKDKTKNGIAPVYSTELGIDEGYMFITTYTGNGTRLQSTMGVAEYTKLKDIKMSAGIWPNPAKESIFLKLSENSGQAVYTIYNQLGQSVLKGSFRGTDANIDLGGIRKGLYFVKVAAEGSDMTAKLIVE